MQSLPAETFIEILEVAYYSIQSSVAGGNSFCPDYETLLSCSLVCKTWAYWGQRILFRNVVIGRRETSQSSFDFSFATFFSSLNKFNDEKNVIPSLIYSFSVDWTAIQSPGT